jgi:hypothetical protein
MIHIQIFVDGLIKNNKIIMMVMVINVVMVIGSQAR